MVSIVIPAYNEQDGITELYRRIVAAAPFWRDDFEILIVDAGSRDRTLEICEELGSRPTSASRRSVFPGISAIRRRFRRASCTRGEISWR